MLSACIAAGMLAAQVFLTPGAMAASGPLAGPPGLNDPGDGWPFWVDPGNRAEAQASLWQERGQDQQAGLVRDIADEPSATWLTESDPGPRAREVTLEARLAGRIPVLVAYNIPQRDCGQYSAGGATDATAYRNWIARLADGIEDRPAWVVLEPDAVAHLVTCPQDHGDGDRLALLSDAVRTLKALPHTSVYVDAGNAGWVTDLPRLADALRQAGVGRANGFALNVSNFQTTQASEGYGDRLSKLLGGAHFVIDTSRNGTGPLRAAGPAAALGWCNPPDRALGHPPTVATGDREVDAYLWVKRPGESDGSCRGGPPAGQWWPDYALRLARDARDWTGFTPVTPRAPSGPATASLGSP
ncbi:glycoside hydrolase family 6 protein [Streptantibioticus parmotrematis]|uniref:glycoside hydrolase family 6 protein n=1 Tax=Streptantibioticus parmotrematis TaxID=2873249 RepID=UPI0033C68F1C